VNGACITRPCGPRPPASCITSLRPCVAGERAAPEQEQPRSQCCVSEGPRLATRTGGSSTGQPHPGGNKTTPARQAPPSRPAPLVSAPLVLRSWYSRHRRAWRRRRKRRRSQNGVRPTTNSTCSQLQGSRSAQGQRRALRGLSARGPVLVVAEPASAHLGLQEHQASTTDGGGREESVRFAQGEVGEHLVLGRDSRYLQLEWVCNCRRASPR
jgi:hypothetical protein